MTVIVGAVCGFGLVALDIARTALARGRRPELAPVTQPLSAQERHAVARVIRRREQAPSDRLDVVRAAALQNAGGLAIPSAAGPVILVTAVAVSGSSFWVVYLGLGIAFAVATAIALRDVALARRYLAAEPV